MKKLTSLLSLFISCNTCAQDFVLADTREEISWNSALWPVGFLIILILLKVFFHLRDKKEKVQFLSDFFNVASKNNIDFKVLGKIHPEEIEKLMPLKISLLNTIHLSRGISNLVELKFNHKNQKNNVEIAYLTNRPLQYLCDNPKEVFLKNHLAALRNEVEKMGGEMFYTSHYNSNGNVYRSSVVLRFDS